MTPLEAAIGILLARAMLSPAHGRKLVAHFRDYWACVPDDREAAAPLLAAIEAATVPGPLDRAPLAAVGAGAYALALGLDAARVAPPSTEIVFALVYTDEAESARVLACVVAAVDPELIHWTMAGEPRLDELAPALASWAQKIDRHGARRSRLERAAAAEVLAMIAEDDNRVADAALHRNDARALLLSPAA